MKRFNWIKPNSLKTWKAKAHSFNRSGKVWRLIRLEVETLQSKLKCRYICVTGQKLRKSWKKVLIVLTYNSQLRKTALSTHRWNADTHKRNNNISKENYKNWLRKIKNCVLSCSRSKVQKMKKSQLKRTKK